MRTWTKPSLNWLLAFIPLGAVAKYAPGSETRVFVFAALAIVPLAGLMGLATEHLAHRVGAGLGGLLNATFGNAAELIIGLTALSQGKYSIVKASLTGSIIGNILLVLGASILAGGLKFKTQRFNRTRASAGGSMLLLAAISFIVPAVYSHLLPNRATARRLDLSLDIALVLIVIYALSLLFELHTHKHLLAGETSEGVNEEGLAQPWPLSKSIGLLAGATVLVAWMSELLVGSVEHASHAMHLNELFIGVIIVAVIGNAAEHSTAVLMATKNKMDLSLSIAIGSSLQIALFVGPVLVLVGRLFGRPMDLVFEPLEVIAVMLSVFAVNQVAQDGESNWLEGAQLLSVYLILGMAFYFLPALAVHP